MIGSIRILLAPGPASSWLVRRPGCWCSSSPFTIIRHLSAKRSPVKRFNEAKKTSFWTKFDKYFEAERPRKYQTTAERNKTTLTYLVSLLILTVGASYAAVPMYRIFCQSSGYGGTTQAGHDTEKVATMTPKKDRVITVKFNADTAATMQWNFRPQQSEVKLFAGETALAFYTARNPTEKPIDGISTYNVVPFEAGQVYYTVDQTKLLLQIYNSILLQYFNKIQCFCFEEQRLNPNEEVDMPVFFYIDPEFLDDPFLDKVETIFLSYTFFESKPGLQLPMMPYHT
jgi:cytochrome c oxidase assembly protein subunit 11